jgi:hypothetical protein
MKKKSVMYLDNYKHYTIIFKKKYFKIHSYEKTFGKKQYFFLVIPLAHYIPFAPMCALIQPLIFNMLKPLFTNCILHLYIIKHMQFNIL